MSENKKGKRLSNNRLPFVDVTSRGVSSNFSEENLREIEEAFLLRDIESPPVLK